MKNVGLRRHRALAAIVVSGLAAGFTAGVLAGAAHAEVIVLKSTVAGLTPGKSLPDSFQLTIPAGKSALLVLPSGATKTVSGPTDTSIGALTQGQQRNAALLDAVKTYVMTGGTRTGSVGATRSAAATMASAPIEFSWTDIPLTMTGDYCVKKGGTLTFVRGNTSRELDVTLIDLQQSVRAKTRFAKGANEASWPRTVEPRIGKYAVVVQGRPLRQIRLRPIDPLPGDADTLRVLFSQRCEAQVEAYLRRLR